MRPLSVLIMLTGLAPALLAQTPASGRGALGGRNLGAITLPAYGSAILMDSIGTPVTLEAAGRQAFAAVMAAYADLKIPVQIRDSVGGLVGNLRLIQTGTFAKDRISHWLDCGSGFSGPKADVWRISIAMVTFLDAKGPKQTVIRTAIAAAAKDIEGTSSDAVRCATTGDLETRLTGLIKKHLNTP